MSTIITRDHDKRISFLQVYIYKKQEATEFLLEKLQNEPINLKDFTSINESVYLQLLQKLCFWSTI